VIARNSSFVYKGKAVDVKQVGRELGVRYVVEGSVRRAADRVRVSAQLIDATTGHHVWAERYDRDLSDIFDLQDEITATIAAAMGPMLGRAEQRRAVAKPPQNLDAWDSYQRAVFYLASQTREGMHEARALCERALELDPTFSNPAAVASLTHVLDVFNQWSDDAGRSIAEAVRLAESSLVLDSDSVLGHSALAWTHIFRQQNERASDAFERSVALNPSYGLGYWGLGVALYSLSRPDDAVAMIEKAMRLSPQDGGMFLYAQTLGMAHFVAGRYVDAADAARRAIALRADQPAHHRLLAASYGHLGKLEDARAELAEMARLAPDFSLEVFRSFNRLVADDMIEGWRKAGWQG
jgi:adenylate cyclase